MRAAHANSCRASANRLLSDPKALSWITWAPDSGAPLIGDNVDLIIQAAFKKG